MKIAIMGTGGVGGYYGGLLALQGHDVTFIARGEHFKALRSRGLKVFSVHGDFSLPPVQAVEDPAGLDPVDFLLFCVKTYDTERSAQAILPLIGPQTTLLSLQNGVDAVERVGAIVGLEHMIAGATWISSAISEPGVIRQVSQFRRIVVGELDGAISQRLQALHNAFQDTGVAFEISQDIMKVLWTKFVFIAAASAVGGLTRLPMGDYRSIPQTQDLVRQVMSEVASLAHTQGIPLEPDVVQKSFDFIQNSAPTIKPSMQVDLEAGRQFELDSMIGVIGRKGRQLGVPTPAADLVYAALLPVNLHALAQSLVL